MKKTGFAEDVRFKMRTLVVALLIVGTPSAGAQEASFVGILKAAKPGPVVGLGSNRDHNGGCST